MVRSFRWTLFVAVAVAVACAEQPTEPTHEATPFQATLPPVPPPPEPLSGELPGGDGFGGSVDLGFWASPTFAKITVSGLRQYHGATSGYLAGEGSIDPAGFFIPNQCSLIVKVREQNSTGGLVVGGPSSCPPQPTQVGSYTNYSIVSGDISAYQTPGPPGSCYKTAQPCIGITGSTTITVDPEPGELVLTANRVLVSAGGGITVNAKGVWATNPGVTVPMTPREWKWEGSGRRSGVATPRSARCTT